MSQFKTYWCNIRRRAWGKSCAAVGWTSGGVVIIRLLVPLVGLVGLAFIAERIYDDEWKVALVTLAAGLVVWALIFLVNLFRIPAILDAEKNHELETLRGYKLSKDIGEQLARFIDELDDLTTIGSPYMGHKKAREEVHSWEGRVIKALAFHGIPESETHRFKRGALFPNPQSVTSELGDADFKEAVAAKRGALFDLVGRILKGEVYGDGQIPKP